MDESLDLSCQMIIFGGTGDLTHRKLLPALYNLQGEKLLPENFAVTAVGRRKKTVDEYRAEIYQSIQHFSRMGIEEDVWKGFQERIYYYSFDFLEEAPYAQFQEYLKKMDEKYNTKGNRMYYMAVAPEYFEPITHKVNRYCMKDELGWQRVVIEKPFGRDLQSAKYLNRQIVSIFQEENTYRIDHYLGKEMLQNIMVLRFANMIFEPLWNNRYIDHIQISANETVGVENRGGYYEKAGAMRDMVQSHLLQLLSLIAMEPPNDLETESIRDEKVKVLKALRPFDEKELQLHAVRGQYGSAAAEKVLGYREEERVDSASTTETFVALKVFVDNLRWEGVPFYIRTGKRMPQKSTEIVIQFKTMKNVLYFKERPLEPNMLVIKIQPTEGIFFQFNGKEPGAQQHIIPVQTDFCQSCRYGINSPEAYERLLYDVMRGERTLFTRWDEVEYEWRFIDEILELWKKENPPFPNYEAGTWGPEEADSLLKRDNRSWIIV